MKKFLYVFLCLALVSCFGDPDDGILDGDLITAITGPDEVFTTAGTNVDYEFRKANLENSNQNDNQTTARISFYGGSDFLIGSNTFETFIMEMKFTDLDILNPVSFNGLNTSVTSIEYSVEDHNGFKRYIIDETAQNFMELFYVNRNSIEGIFEFYLINEEDPTDLLVFKEGYFYVYD